MNKKIIMAGGFLLLAGMLGLGCSSAADPSQKDRNGTGKLDLPETGATIDTNVACDEEMIAQDFSADETGLPIVYVDAAADESVADGTAVHPFITIEQAFLTVTAPAKLLVAEGEYNLAEVPVGWHIYGGYDGTFTTSDPSRKAVIHSPVTAIDEQTLSIGDPSFNISNPSGALTVLVNLDMAEMNIDSYETNLVVEMSRIGGVIQEGATLRLVNNEVIKPEGRALYEGVFLSESCAFISGNQIINFSTPVWLNLADTTQIVGNQIQNGNNGIVLSSSSPEIIGNSFDLFAPEVGCVYAIYMEGTTHPVIRENDFFLNNCRSRGINESDSLDADPAALVGNHFHIHECGTPIYFDADQEPSEGMMVYAITDVNEVNLLTDIPLVGGNTLEMF